MNILITGGGGYIGSHLTHYLRCLGHNVTIVDDYRNCGVPPLWKECVEEGDCAHDSLEGILNNYEINAVIHLAADKNPNMPGILPNNVMGTVNTFVCAKRANVSLMINISSAAVYGNTVNPLREDKCSLHPIDSYGESKMVAEQYLREATRGADVPNVVNLRLFNVAGTCTIPTLRREWAATGVLQEWVGQLLCGRTPILHKVEGIHIPTRDFIHVYDICRVIHSALIYGMNSDKKYVDINVGRGTAIHLLDLLSMFEDILGEEIKPLTEPISDKVCIIKCVADIEKMERLLGISPIMDLKEIVESSFAVG